VLKFETEHAVDVDIFHRTCAVGQSNLLALLTDVFCSLLYAESDVEDGTPSKQRKTEPQATGRGRVSRGIGSRGGSRGRGRGQAMGPSVHSASATTSAPDLDLQWANTDADPEQNDFIADAGVKATMTDWSDTRWRTFRRWTSRRRTTRRRYISPTGCFADGTSRRRGISPTDVSPMDTSPTVRLADGMFRRRDISPTEPLADGTSCRRHVSPMEWLNNSNA
jgi:hypothetical protein